MKRYLAPAALLCSFLAHADSSSSDSLGLDVWVNSSCPFSQSELRNRVEGEFVRARMKPTNSRDFYLVINVSCMNIENRSGHSTGTAVSYETRLGFENDDGDSMLFEYPNFGSMLIGGKDASSSSFFLNAIRDSASNALTEILKARL